MSNPGRGASMKGWHLWFGVGGLLFAVIGLIAREWPLAIVAACLAAYAFGMLLLRRS